jgi:1,4-dihydroxy-2-naphthoyl-CoA hydrolase
MAGLLDLELISEKDDEIQAKVAVSDALKQPLGLVHGGVFATIADAITAQQGRAISNQTSFLRPITDGTIHATARRRHNGRTTAVWEVEIRDGNERLCALVRMTVTKP